MKKNLGMMTYKIRVTEAVTYDLMVDAYSATEARKKVRAINDGRYSLSDFSPNGDAVPLHFGNVVINSVEEVA